MADDETSVRVALRIRPQIAREKIEMCRVCTTVTPGEPQVVLGSDKAFTFDHVFDMQTDQDHIYKTCVSQLLEGCFDGYNATVLAYGQTGSGKTYTMGTGFEVSTTSELQGIIPRAVQHIFDGIHRRKTEAVENGLPEPFFQVSVQFIELYREEILDLLDQTRDVEASRATKSNIKIHEDHRGNIYMTGVASAPVSSAEETMNVLRNGALTRTTAKTNMNAQSSRSHAIFTLHISQQRFLKQDAEEAGQDQDGSSFETLTAKFHFVDLAGSERLKRTGATGIRAEEGININCGLLALGNVISALGDASKKVSHVPYRDSKLTRLLQDSLGGNSRTTMIACISPSDCDFLETLNTLKYANRARNIKNKVVVNQDRSSRVISELRARVQALELELAEYKQGKRMATTDGGEAVNDMYHENTLLQAELNQLRLRVKALQESQDVLRARNADILCEMEARSLKARRVSENGAAEMNGENGDTGDDEQLKSLIRKYLEEIEELRAKLCESESASQLLRQQVARYKTSMQSHQRYASGPDGLLAAPPNLMMVSSPNGMMLSMNGDSFNGGADDVSVSPLLNVAKADIERLKARSKEIKQTRKNGDGGQHDNGGENGGTTAETETATGSDNEDENEESGDSESDEKEEEFGKYQQDLADLQCEISLKERLVDELVQSQKRLHAVRMQYEEKLTQLQLRIQDTELERDRILAALEQKQKTDDRADTAAAAKVRKDYEERLCSLRNEMKRLQAAQREHQRLAREQQQNQAQIARLSNELQEMKKAKVALMQKMKEEANKARAAELKRQKELAQLQKEARRRENELRELKMKEQRREAIFKRKQEEMQNLRRAQRPASTRTQQQTNSTYVGGPAADRTFVAGNRTTLADSRRRRSERVLSKLAKQHWIQIEKTITNQVVKKQTIAQMEQELERCMQNRDEKRRKLENLRSKKANVLETSGLLSAPMDRSVLADIDDQIESVQANIDYLQDQIAECQKQIMEVEEGAKEDSEPQEQGATALFGDCESLDEAKYLLEHLYNFCVAQGSLAAQKEAALKETEIKLQQTQQEFHVHQKLLQHLISSNPEVCGLPDTMASSMESMSGSIQAPAPAFAGFFSAPQLSVDEKSDDHSSHSTAHLPIPDRFARDKARRRTATPEELLYSETTASDHIRPPLNVVFELDDYKTDEDSMENPKEANGSRTRDCSPEDTTRRANGSNGTVPPLQNGVGRSNSCVEVGSGSRAADSKAMPPPPVPPKKHHLDQQSGTLTRSNATKRRHVAASISESDGETSGAVHGSMTVSDTVVPLRRAANLDQPNAEQLQAMGSTSSLNAGPFTRGQAIRNTIAVSDSASNRRIYGFRSYSTKGSTTDMSMKRTAPAVVINAAGPLSLSTSISSGTTPPASPRFLRRQVGHMNVFSRLAASTGAASSEDTGDSDSQSQGILYEYDTKAKSTFKNNPLECLYVAEGHKKAVLSMAAEGSVFATGSKDRTVKLWDLEKGMETATLANHPNHVQCVRLHSAGHMLFSVSGGIVKVWDLRSLDCVKTLSSSGLTIDGEFSPSGSLNTDMTITGSRQATFGQNEAAIAQVDVTPAGDYLFTAAYNQVRIWDIRNFAAVGKLSNATSTPKSEVSCMKIIPLTRGLRVAVGSRDHYIKVFNLPPGSLAGNFDTCQQLDPPHYDGITSLASFGEDGRWLFSASRDQCLVKWDLADGRRVQPMPKAHNNWILSLAFLPPPFQGCLLSACRDGMIRMWDARSFSDVGKIYAHKVAINCLTTNSSLVFTGSNDSTVGIWKPRQDLLPSLLSSTSTT